MREKYYEWLHNFLGLDPWHAVPNTERPFGFHVLKKLNSLLRKTGKENLIVEIGCGLGDIISSLDYPNSKKHGYDLNPKVVWGARLAHPFGNFHVGTYDKVRGKRIEILIVLGFLQTLPYGEVKQLFDDIIKGNQINVIVVEEVKSPPYKYAHDYVKLFGQFGYHLGYRSKGETEMETTRKRSLFFFSNSLGKDRGNRHERIPRT